MNKLIHLKKDLRINKATIWSAYNNDGEHLPKIEHTERGFDRLKALLDKRTQSYTKDECEVLVESYLCSHDYCVMDNFRDFLPIEVYQANQKYGRMVWAINKLKEL